MKFKNLAMLSLAAVLFVACAGDIPKCGDEAVQKALKEYYFEEVKKEAKKEGVIIDDNDDRFKLMKFNFSSFMSELTDEENKVQHCKAKITISPIISPTNDNENFTVWFKYSAKYADNKDEVIIEDMKEIKQ